MTSKRLISCQIQAFRPIEKYYLYIIDLMNFEIIALILNEEIEGHYNPAEFNKVYNSLGCQKYMQIGWRFIKINHNYNEVGILKSMQEFCTAKTLQNKLSPLFLKSEDGNENFEKNLVIDFELYLN